MESVVSVMAIRVSMMESVVSVMQPMVSISGLSTGGPLAEVVTVSMVGQGVSMVSMMTMVSVVAIVSISGLSTGRPLAEVMTISMVGQGVSMVSMMTMDTPW